jgi:hypothetical protein
MRIQATISPERTALLRRAVFIHAGQSAVARKLKVTQQTVSRWLKETCPIPEAVLLWCASEVDKEDQLASQALED